MRAVGLRRYAAYFIAAIIVFLAGFSASLWMVIHPFTKLILLRSHLIEEHVIPRDNEQSGAVMVPCPAGAKVIILGGQSNAANQTGSRGRFPPYVVNFYRGHCYKAADPLLGASGDQGSVWSRVAWKEPIILVPIAVGQTRISEWTPGGALWPRILLAIDDLRTAGFKPNVVWWHQGESDAMAGVSPESYAQSIHDLVSALNGRGISRIVIATASKCKHVESPDLVAAQRKAIKDSGATIGPETDNIGDDFRRDGCHFNDKGAMMAASMWSQQLN